MESLESTKILEQVLLPLNSAWEVSTISTDSSNGIIYVYLDYKFDTVFDNGVSYSIYDHRKARKWRHLDLWQYKTYLVARVPRYKDSSGFYKTVRVPWAEEYERLTVLLEKKL